MNQPNSIKKTARIAGIMLLVMALIGPFSMMYVPSQLIIPGDASGTVANIMAFSGLFRLGILGHIIILLADLGVALLLYTILKPVNRIAAIFAAALRLIMVGIRGTNLINYLIVLQLIEGGSHMAAYDPGTLPALVMLFMDAFNYGLDLDMVFFSFHLLFLGYLVYYSGFFPRFLGVLLYIACVGYLSIALSSLFFTAYEKVITSIFTIPNAVSELALMLWLLIRGINVEKWAKRAIESVGS